MRIVYAVTTCSDRTYKELYAKAQEKPSFQAQKYHKLLIEGLASHEEVEVVANPPINRSVLSKAITKLPPETEGGAHYRYIPAVRNPLLKAAVVGIGIFFHTLLLANGESAVMVDCLNRVASLSALCAARLRGRPCVGIVTDLPDMLPGSGLSKRISNYVIRHCTSYVLLTQAMNDYLNPDGKPYVILEGHADITMEDKIPSLAQKRKPRSILYAGGISKLYGLANLVEGFCMADLEDARLEIYGQGDYVEELKTVAAEDPRVVYGGMLLSSQVVEKEMEATLLVNPRPTGEEYVKYSFPSKTMEYMSTGTPVLTTILPGMPKDYHSYVYLLNDESPEGIAKKLREVMSQTDEELFEKGAQARRFILDNKNNVLQARKIVQMLTIEQGV